MRFVICDTDRHCVPVDRVDDAAYRHDMVYAAFPDTKTLTLTQ